MRIYKEGDVVRLHCPDPSCHSCDDLSPALVLRPYDNSKDRWGETYDWYVKPLFHPIELGWCEQHMSFAVAPPEAT